MQPSTRPPSMQESVHSANFSKIPCIAISTSQPPVAPCAMAIRLSTWSMGMSSTQTPRGTGHDSIFSSLHVEIHRPIGLFLTILFHHFSIVPLITLVISRCNGTMALPFALWDIADRTRPKYAPYHIGKVPTHWVQNGLQTRKSQYGGKRYHVKTHKHAST
jgi:hypothetical protein